MTIDTNALSETGLRRRRPSDVSEKIQSQHDYIHPKPQRYDHASHKSSISGLVIILGCLALSILFVIALVVLPKRHIAADAKIPPSPERPFDTSKAMNHIREIAAQPRWVGSKALEDALVYIYDDLVSLQDAAKENALELEVELFRSEPSSFFTSVSHIDLINTYSNISSVVARLRPQHLPVDTSMSSLLINAHVDSAAGSPGASDNVCGVGVGMEVLRCLVVSKVHEITRPIVFLFNGGEEVVLDGAHSFVSQHRFAPTVAAHINLESLGPGDTYSLFRLGPHNPWLLEAYANSVSIPSTGVTASDVFDAKIVPGETDFRVFSEWNIPGFDFVILDNGFVYHTIHDSIDKVNPLGVYHGGRTTLELALELAGRSDAIGKHESGLFPSSPGDRLYAATIALANSLGLVKDPDRPRAVFFDVFNLKTIVYEEGVAAVLHICVLFVTALIWVAKLTDMGPGGVRRCLRMCLIFTAGALACFASASFASLVYSEAYASKLRWYGSIPLAIVMFAPPAIFGVVSAVVMLLPRKSSLYRFDEMLLPVTLFNFALAVIMLRLGFMSSYLPTLILMATNLCALQGDGAHPVLRYMELSVVHVVLGTKMSINSLSALLPLLGRSKSETIPHDMIAAFLVGYFTLTFIAAPLLPLLCQYGQSLRALQRLTFLCTVAIGFWLVLLNPAHGESRKNAVYSTDAPKRFLATHFYSPHQEPNSVVAVMSSDPISMDTHRIFSKVPNIEGSDSYRNSFPVWGELESNAIETVRPYSNFLQDIAVLGIDEKPDLPSPTVVVDAEKELDSGWNVTYTIEALDSHQMTFRFLAGSNSSVVAWSIDAPMPNGPEGAWIRHTGTSSYSFWILLVKSGKLKQRPALRIVVTSGRFGTSRSPNVLSKLIFEDWEAPIMLTSVGTEVLV